MAKLSGSNIYYFHQDALGNTRFVTMGATTTFSTNYQPFGAQYGASGTNPVYKYTGQAQDSPTSLYHLGARYYDTSVGTFLTRDPLTLRTTSLKSQCGSQCGSGRCLASNGKSPAVPQGLNPYEYALNRPLNNKDPSGLDCSPNCALYGFNLQCGLYLDLAIVFGIVACGAAALGCIAFFGIGYWPCFWACLSGEGQWEVILASGCAAWVVFNCCVLGYVYQPPPPPAPVPTPPFIWGGGGGGGGRRLVQ